MSKSKTLKEVEMILERWVAELKNKDRSRAAVSSNFDDLFSQLSNANVDFDEAHAIIDDAARAHYPPDFIARKTYNALEKKKGADKQTYKEYVDNWRKDIKDSAVECFYIHYRSEPPKEEKKYGNMSEREYKAQRRYADAFPVITYEEIQKRMKQLQHDLTEPLEVTLEDKNVDKAD